MPTNVQKIGRLRGFLMLNIPCFFYALLGLFGDKKQDQDELVHKSFFSLFPKEKLDYFFTICATRSASVVTLLAT
jgi:hypothetical protein